MKNRQNLPKEKNPYFRNIFLSFILGSRGDGLTGVRVSMRGRSIMSSILLIILLLTYGAEQQQIRSLDMAQEP